MFKSDSSPLRFSYTAMVELFNTIVVRFLVLGINFLATTLITRNLSVEDRGKYGYLLNLLYLLMTFLSFGFHSSIVYIISNKKQYFPYLYTLSLIISIFTFIFLGLSSVIGLTEKVFPTFGLSDQLILIIGTPLFLFNYFNSFFFLSINDFKNYNRFEFLKNFIFLFLTLITYNIIISYQTYLSFFVLSNFIYVALSIYFFKNHGLVKIHFFEILRNMNKLILLFKKSVSTSTISYISCILSFILGKYVLFFIGSFLDTTPLERETLGLYSVALSNIDIIMILPTTLAFYIFPKISAVQHMKEKISLAMQMIGLCTLFMVGLTIFSYFFLQSIFDFLYGSAYQDSVPLFMLMLPSALFLSIISCISSFIGGLGMNRTAIYAPLWSLVFILISSLYLIKFPFNVYHYIYIQNISYFLYLLIYIRYFFKQWKGTNNVKENVGFSSFLKNG